MANGVTAVSAAARRAEYADRGFLVVRGLFSPAETGRLTQAFMDMHAKGGVPGKYEPRPQGFNDGFHYDFSRGDPLAAFPRVMWPHEFMPEIKAYVLDSRIFDVFEDLLGQEVYNASSMFYFKPPGARGQAFHQDNFYLRVKPGTCHACWIACDRCDEENGALRVVPRSHRLPIYCPEAADPAHYFAKELVKPPEGMEPEMPILEAGDALFFHGNLIHGSEPNRSADRFRRSLVLHFVPEDTVEVARYEAPLYDRRGNPLRRKDAGGGGPCGTPYSIIH
jgi:phytanoyl-CoA hydroxylase